MLGITILMVLLLGSTSWTFHVFNYPLTHKWPRANLHTDGSILGEHHPICEFEMVSFQVEVSKFEIGNIFVSLCTRCAGIWMLLSKRVPSFTFAMGLHYFLAGWYG